MPFTVQPTTRRSPIKTPERYPSCNSRDIAPKGTRTKKLETIRLYRCRACGRGLTPGPRAMRNKTFPLNEILEALTAYNRGFSLEDTGRRLSSRHGHTVNPATISRWLAAHPGLTTYRRLRARGLKLFHAVRIIRTIKLYHRQVLNSLITAPSSPFCARARSTTGELGAATRASLPLPISSSGFCRSARMIFLSAKMRRAGLRSHSPF